MTPPHALSELGVPYPEGGHGEARVVLEVEIAEDGSVSQSRVLSGEEPFATAASSRALGWRFAPALRGGTPVAARIRLEVTFVPEPASESAPPVVAPPAPAETPAAAERSATTAAGAPPLAAEPDPVEIVVEGERAVDKKSLGKSEVRQMPGAFGDPYRAIEALPGVTPIASGLPYFFVRGAPPGNVGYFFGRVPVPLLYHAAAGPGVIHPAFIESVDLYAGGYPARFGRHAGGIVSGERAEPEWRLRGETSIRLVDAGGFLEVPFAGQRGSAMLAGRYSYTGLVVSLLAPEVSVGYWDYQGRVSYQFTNEDSLTVFGFGSHDFLAAADASGRKQEVLDLTFHRLDTSYRRQLGASSALEVGLMLGLDRTGLGGDPDEEEQDPADLRNRSIGGRVEFEHAFSRHVRLRSGVDVLHSRYDVAIDPPDGPDDADADDDGTLPTLEEVSFPEPGFPELVLDRLRDLQFQSNVDTVFTRFPPRSDLVTGAHVEVSLALDPVVTVIPGFRLDAYRTGRKTTLAPEPRLGARFDVHPNVALTHAVGIAHQPPSFAIPIPGLGGTADEGLQRAVQSSAGVEAKLPHGITAAVTAFQNIIFDSTDLFGLSSLATSSAQVNPFQNRTTAHSYGLEFHVRRSLTEELGGFAAYTLSRSTRSVGRLRGPSSFDRRHVINLALAYDLGRNWRLGTRALAYSGIPAEVAYPEAAIQPPRTPWYYRLDWRLEKRWLIGRRGAFWALVVEVLNTTLNNEVLESSCYAHGCYEEPIGPVTIPSIGVEASF